VEWEGYPGPAPFPFRPSRILAETSETDVRRKWWFQFQRLDFSSRFIDVVEAKVDASKTSTKTAQANVSFHGNGLCYVSKKCNADTLPDHCIGRRHLL